MAHRQTERIPHPLAWIFTSTLALLASFALAAPAAHAGPLVASAPSCSDFEMSQVFLPWVDPADYVLDPGGSFEDGAAGWTLSGAQIASGNEPYHVGNASDSNSLSLPGGSSATTSTVCVGLEHPSVRFFARNTGSPLGTLRVDVLFEDAAGAVHSVPIGVVLGLAGGWQVSTPMPIIANLLPLLPGNYTPVAFKLTPQGGSWKVDDFYVDPRHGG
jgi:hypothetical protein